MERVARLGQERSLSTQDVEPGDVDGASVRLPERVEFLTAAPGWPDALTVAVSDRVSLVLSPR